MNPRLYILAAVLALPCAPVIAVDQILITKDSVATFYRNFKRLTVQPHYVAPLTGMLCRSPSKEQLDKETTMTGPHTRVLVHIYANPTSANSIASNDDVFPVGAVIIKEKFPRDAKEIAGIGGMVKRAKGYDPAGGDWEFFYYTPGGDFSTGKLANCVECHNGGKRDHVFSVWSLDKQGLLDRIMQKPEKP